MKSQPTPNHPCRNPALYALLVFIFLLFFAAPLYYMSYKENPYDKKLLYYSVNGYLPGIVEALEKGANVNTKDNTPTFEGETPLMKAALYGDLEVAKTLIRYGAKIDARDERGETPFLTAAAMGRLEFMKLLADEGANINKPAQNGYTPLMVAADRGFSEIVDFLLEREAPVNKKSQNGFTATMAAAKRSPEILKRLIAKGAEIHAKTDYGATALMVAAYANNPESVKILIAEEVSLYEMSDSGKDAMIYSLESIFAGTPEGVENQAEIFRLFLDSGYSVDTIYPDKDSLLHKALKISNLTSSPNLALFVDTILLQSKQPYHLDKNNFSAYHVAIATLDDLSYAAKIRDEFIRRGYTIKPRRDHSELVDAKNKGDDEAYLQIIEKELPPERVWTLLEGAPRLQGLMAQREIKKGETLPDWIFQTSLATLIPPLCESGDDYSEAFQENLAMVLKSLNSKPMHVRERAIELLLENCSGDSLQNIVSYFRPRELSRASIYPLARYAPPGSLDAMIDYGLFVNTRDREGNTLLMNLCPHMMWENSEELFETLLKHRPKLNVYNKEGDSFFHLCLNQRRSDQGPYSYYNAKYADYIYRAYEAQRRHIKANLSDANGVTLLMLASQNGFTYLVDSLLEDNAKVELRDEDGLTALMMAYLNRQSAIVDKLIEAGASQDDLSIFEYIENNRLPLIEAYIEKLGFSSWPLLEYAKSRHASEEVLSYLAFHLRPIVNHSLVFDLYQRGYVEEARAMVEKGFHPNSVTIDYFGRGESAYLSESAVAKAIRMGDYDLLEVLLQHGGRPDMVNQWGAIEWEGQSQFQEPQVQALLERYGSQTNLEDGPQAKHGEGADNKRTIQ